jgi:predicted N-acyltransferase
MQTYLKATTQFERLDMRFFQRIAREPSAHFLLLRDRGDGRLAAFMLLMDLGEAVVNKFIGIDYDRPRDWMLYFRLTDGAVDWAMARGAERLQSGQTGYRVKIELGHTLVPLLNYGRHRVALIHWIYALVARTITWKTLDTDLAHHLEAHPDNPRAEPGLW